MKKKQQHQTCLIHCVYIVFKELIQGINIFQAPDTEADILNCKLSLQYGKTEGRKCCGGFDTYNPRFETCCQRDLKYAVRHKDKKERNHAYVNVLNVYMCIQCICLYNVCSVICHSDSVSCRCSKVKHKNAMT